MFIKITDNREEEDKYINIFKICEIKPNMVCIDGLANIKRFPKSIKPVQYCRIA